MTQLDLLEEAWALIANASGGNWNLETADWRAAAARFREKYHAELTKYVEQSADHPVLVVQN